MARVEKRDRGGCMVAAAVGKDTDNGLGQITCVETPVARGMLIVVTEA